MPSAEAGLESTAVLLGVAGLAVAADGTIYMTADADNALYRLLPRR